MKMIRVKTIHSVLIGAKLHDPNTELRLPESDVQDLLALGAVSVIQEPIPEVKSEAKKT